MNIVTTRAARHSLSLPNILTYARIAAIPVVVGCIYAQAIMDGPLWLRWVALAVFVAAGVTDFLDGYYARIWDQHSAFGRMLDPIADKLLVASCLLMLAADGIIHGWTLWAAIVILCREILVSGLREYLAALRVSEMEDHGSTGRDRIPARRRGWRSTCAGRDPGRIAAAVDLGDFHHLHRLGLLPRRSPSPHRGG
jgi:phosphatidylglycerophosphate synthase